MIEAWARNLPVIAAASEGPGWLIADGEWPTPPVEDHRMAPQFPLRKMDLLLAWLAQGTNGSRPNSRRLPSLRNSSNFLIR